MSQVVAKVFDQLATTLMKHGEKEDDGVYSLSDLMLDGEGEERAISFSLIGTDFAVTSTGIFSVEETDDGELQSFALTGPLEETVAGYLNWRRKLIESYGL